VIKETYFHMLERVPPEHSEVDRQLRDYGAWLRDRAVSGHCASAEWRFEEGRAPDDEKTSTRRGTINVREMLGLFEVVAKLPMKHRIIINRWYVNRSDYRRIRKEAAVSWDALPGMVRAARQMVINKLSVVDNH
jgi:hypothetical protein